MFVDQAHARRIGHRLAALRERVPSRVYPPVIENVGDVQDRAGAGFDQAYDQIVILGAVGARPQPTQSSQNIQANGEQVVDTVLSQQPLAIDVRLEHRGEASTGRVEGVLVRVDRSRLRARGEAGRDHGQSVGRQHIVMVQEQRHLTVRCVHRRVGGRHNALRRIEPDQIDPRIAGGLGSQDLSDLRRRRTVVHDAQPPVAVDLPAHLTEAIASVRRARIVHRHQDRNPRQAGHAGQPGADRAGVARAGFVPDDPRLIRPGVGNGGSSLDRRPDSTHALGVGLALAVEEADDSVSAHRPDLDRVGGLGRRAGRIDPRP